MAGTNLTVSTEAALNSAIGTMDGAFAGITAGAAATAMNARQIIANNGVGGASGITLPAGGTVTNKIGNLGP